ncbi:DUF4843 domain-containing protein [Flavobacterium tyrosinilyticum]|uniref:DUF4843 domain-containing protein n=1 Tax=Flavobacterium tyrosinilyticum TaxID=1658740 RepID=UPI00202FA455|nr:DUF4843 domain-containing protein [Flavobacterium tyrosinilyticum]MCM0668121.1 DUF4843 domain-containing protein [Flavobacterium tyrosinilyticum]
MKKILILSILLFSLFGLTSCDKEEIETYKATNNIYFPLAVFPAYNNAPLIDSTGFSFSFDKSNVTGRIYSIPVQVQGAVSDVDRQIKVSVDPSSTAILGTHFSLPENIVLHAGREIDSIPVRVNRTLDLKDKSVTLVLNLEENEFFTVNMKDRITNVLTQKKIHYTRFKLTFTDKLMQPIGWQAVFGVFTAKKFFLMCELMNLDPEMFNQAQGSPGLSIPETLYYASFMKRYLADQKANGNTIYEEDGKEMLFP